MTATIFAHSSGPGPSGVAVFRLSGSAAKETLRRLTRREVPAPRQAVLRALFDPGSGEEIDSGLVLFFPGPGSFTGEDVIELQIHGSVATIRALARVLATEPGLRAAEAGEFTQRAFRNGKLGLLEVESLGELLAAETLVQARAALTSAQRLGNMVAIWRENILAALALSEAAIDFSDEADVSTDIDSDAQQHILQLIKDLELALVSLEHGERLRRGYRIALCGPPNAGKSSLINALARRDVAIVSPLAGTTRDVIEVHFDLSGYPAVLSDTAGIRETSDMIEVEGVNRALMVAGEADLVLWLSPCDAPQSAPWPEAWVVQSKGDLSPSRLAVEGKTRFISVTTGEGLDELVAELTEAARESVGITDGVLVLHARQTAELRQAVAALRKASMFEGGMIELRAQELREALSFLDRLTGRIDVEEVLGMIFSRFCIGK